MGRRGGGLPGGVASARGPLVYHAGVLSAALLLGALLTGPPAVGWHRCELEAHRLFLKATASITVERCPLGAVAADLRTPPLGEGVLPTGRMVDVIRVEASLPFGRRERITVWIDPATGAVLQNEKRRFGKGAYWKVRRATDDGYYEWRTEPDLPGDHILPPPQWSDRAEHQVVFDPPPPPGTVVTDPYALLAALPALERSDRPVAVVSGRLAVPVRIHRAEPETARADVLLRWPGGARTARRLPVRPVQIRVAPPPGVERGKVRTGVFGMRGDLEILVAEGTGLPVAIRGRAPGVGRVTVRLRRAELDGPPPEGSP